MIVNIYYYWFLQYWNIIIIFIIFVIFIIFIIFNNNIFYILHIINN